MSPELNTSAPGGRESNPEVSIDSLGRWFFQRDALIDNPNVLAYFKANLRRDGKGFFIENHFGELVEIAYLESVEGFPLEAQIFVESLAENQAETSRNGAPSQAVFAAGLDSGQRVLLSPAELFMVDENTIGFLTEHKVPVRLSPVAMASLTEFLQTDEEGNYSLQLGDQPPVPLQKIDRKELFS